MSHFEIEPLLETATLSIDDVVCDGACRHRSAEECAGATHLVFPYRGAFMRHLGRDEAVAEANQLLFFNVGEAYHISHPVAGGDACLTFAVDPALLQELAPKNQLQDGADVTFRRQRRRIDPRAQALVAMLRHSLKRNLADTLEAETLALTLVRRSLGERTSHGAGATPGRQKLAERTKLVLSSDLAKRWTLAEIATEVGVSPVYLTQVFQQAEAIPLYRYQLHLRLARALDLLGRSKGGQYDDLTQLGLELGFSSHSHFSAAFRRVYGCTPTEFRSTIHRR
jgi:AraC-like DNA-binding protein